MKIGVFQDEESDFMTRLESQINAGGAHEFSLNPKENDFDVLIWQKSAPEKIVHPLFGRVLICGGEKAQQALGCCRCESLITVGTSPSDTFTLSSSLLHKGGIAALQHEIKRLDGSTVPPQDMYLDSFTGTMQEKMTMKACEVISSICL